MGSEMCIRDRQGGLSWIMTSLVWVSRRKKKAFRRSPTEPLHLQCFRNFQRLKHRWERLTKTHKSVSFYFRQRESSNQLSFILNRCPARDPLFLTDKFTFVSGLLGQPGVVHTYTTENFLNTFFLGHPVNHFIYGHCRPFGPFGSFWGIWGHFEAFWAICFLKNGLN